MKQKGVTLIELMITMVMVALLASVAVPSFLDTVKSNRVTSNINKLTTTLNLARSEAIRRAGNITVCRSGNGTGCATSGAWTQGWIAFVDIDGDGVVEAADGDEVVLVNEALPGADTTLMASANAADRVTFNSRGFAPGFSATFTLCDDRGNAEAKAVIISNTGRVQRAVDTDADEIENDDTGANLSC